VRERERERERARERERERERQLKTDKRRVKESVCVCVCVCVRERERVCKGARFIRKQDAEAASVSRLKKHWLFSRSTEAEKVKAKI